MSRFEVEVLMHRSLSRVAVVGLVLAFAVPAVHAQTVDEILAKNLQAKGGVETLKGTTSVRMTGKANIQGMDVPITSSVKRPYMMHNQLDMGGQKVVQAFDGTTMWMAMGDNPPQALPDGPQIEAMKQNSAFDPVFLDYKAKGHTIELVGKETDGGKAVNHLRVTTKGGMKFDYYLDADTGLETRFTTTADVQGQKTEIETRMSDYRTIEGRTLPFTVTQFMNGNQVGQMKFEKIEFNVPIDDAIFKMTK
jgi:outer membrane lipoprotein-sorting protein